MTVPAHKKDALPTAQLGGKDSAESAHNNESHTYQEGPVLTNQPTRHPAVPSNFTRAIDPTNGQPTNIYWGPYSNNEVVQVYILDPGHDLPLRVEYRIEGQFPDVDYMDAANIADEIYQFIACWNAETIFGANGELPEEVAA